MATQTKPTTIRFELRTSQPDKDGRAALRIVYQYQQQRKFLPLKEKCFAIQWNSKEQQAIFISRKQAKKVAPELDYELLMTEVQVNEFNDKLSEHRKAIRDKEQEFKLAGITYTPSKVLEAIAAKKPEVKKDDVNSVVAFILHYSDDNKATTKEGTLKVYRGLAAHIRDYERQSGRKALFQKIDVAFMRGFNSFLCSDRTVIRKDKKGNAKKVEIPAMNNITAAKQLSTLKTLLNYARVQYKIEVNPSFRDYSISRKDSNFEVITLTREEFETLYNFDLSGNTRLAQVRDIFCFSCATSLRISDLAQLRWEHIRGNSIKMTAAKTGQKLDIPLNQYSAAILEKYRDTATPLPQSSHKKFISGQRLNSYIKELCKLAEINTPIEIVRHYGIKKVATIYPKYDLVSIHTGRKTFITLSLEKGIPLQEVMAFSAHTTFKAVKRYVDVSEKQKKATMAKAWGEAPSQLKVAQ